MPAHRKNYDDAVKMYEQGMSVGDVAEYFGITRQGMWVVLKRRNVKFRSQLKYAEENHFFRHGKGYTKEQKRAVNLVNKAIRRGKVIPKPCQKCGFEGRCKDGRNKVHAHHDDYSQPLKIRWLCKKCHDEEHNA